MSGLNLHSYREIAAGTMGAHMAPADVVVLLNEIDRLRERLEDKTRSIRVEIAAKQAAYNDIKAAEEEARSWRAVAERLETEMQDLLHACDCEIRDQTNNRTASDKQSAAYAEGALRVAKGIAHRIREKAAAR